MTTNCKPAGLVTIVMRLYDNGCMVIQTSVSWTSRKANTWRKLVEAAAACFHSWVSDIEGRKETFDTPQNTSVDDSSKA